MFHNRLKVEENICPLYKKMQRDTKPVFIWGIGALAAHIYNYCTFYKIHVEACFVNSPVTDKKFRGLDVLSIDEVLDKYPQFSVIIGHSNYIGGQAYLKKIRNVANVYCVTSCCYGIWNSISVDFIKDNNARLEYFYHDLPDETSKKCLKTYFESRINDKAEYMFPCFEQGFGYYMNDVVSLTADEVLLDIGACVGNAIWPFVDAVDGKYKKIVALEPDDANYHMLLQNIRSHGLQSIITRKVCAYGVNQNVRFSGSGETGGINDSNQNYRIYPATTIDSLCEELGPESIPSIVKINFPCSVPEILCGAINLIRSSRPKVIIRAGLDENVLLKTYETIRQLNPDYQIYLRYTIGIPQGLTIFAI